eukprot:Sspe_Gene.71296::Locus_42223_Transcript_1_2_Confidence_0.667_Length_1497::g.71296::m.71296/K00326/E1.6.2.2; cytochrome-b5 reductase
MAAPAATAPGDTPVPPAEYVDVCDVADLRGGRKLVQVPPKDGRYVALMQHEGALHAIDATCYHMGGPLLQADIEEVPGFGPCVTCPWHRYQIRLETGEKLLMGMNQQMKAVPGCRQRVHKTKVVSGRVHVQLSTEGKVESDNYAYKRPAPSQGLSSGLPRSGDVLQGTIGGMISRSLRGADGAAPWALQGPPPRISASSSTSALPPGVLMATTWGRFTVTGRDEAGKDTVVLEVRALGAAFALGGCGRHVDVRVEVDGKEEVRPYTPYIRPGGPPNTITLLVKSYPNGVVSPRLSSATVGSAVTMRGPHAGYPKGFLSGARQLVMIAGGTGVAPMMQVLYSLVGGPGTISEVVLLNCHRTEEHLLLPNELSKLEKVEIFSFRVVNIISNPRRPGPPAHVSGHITPEVLARYAPPPSDAVRVLFCGPPAFNDAVGEMLSQAGYAPEGSHGFE